MTLNDTQHRAAADDQLIAAVLTGLSPTRAAEQTGMSKSTVQRRLADPGFQRRLAEERAQVRRQVVDRVTSTATVAVGVLAQVLADPSASPATRVRAADVALSAALRWSALVDLDARVAALEQRNELGQVDPSTVGDLASRLAVVLDESAR